MCALKLHHSMTWAEKRSAMRAHLASEDLDSFLRWSTVEGNFWVGEAPYIPDEYNALEARWKRVLYAEGFGARNITVYATSGNLIHQAYHAQVFETLADCQLDTLDEILEIGPGYGALAALIFRQGFMGTYYSYDFVEMQRLQEHYLGKSKRLNFCKTPVDCPINPDLFIGIHSFSEMEVYERDGLLSVINPRIFFFLYASYFDGEDNSKYFEGVVRKCKNYMWSSQVSPAFDNHHYLVGVKK